MKNKEKLIATFELPDELKNEMFKVSIYREKTDYQMIIENKETGESFGFKYAGIEDLWEVIAGVIIRFRKELKKGE